MRRALLISLLGMAGVLIAGQAPVCAQTAGGRRPYDQTLARGLAAMEDGLYPLAQRYFEEAHTAARTPEERRAALLGVVRALTERQRFDEAEKRLLSEIEETFAPGPRGELITALARVRLAANRVEESLAALQTLVPSSPPQPWEADALRLLAGALLKADHPDEALAVFDGLIEQFPGDPMRDFWQLEAAALWEEQGVPEEAIARLNALIETAGRPVANEARLRRARLDLRLGRADEAKQHLEPILNDPVASPSHQAEAWLLTAAVCEQRGEWAEAREALTNAAAKSDAPALRRRIRISEVLLRVRIGELAEARTKIHELMREGVEDPAAAAAHLELAAALRARGEAGDALAEYERHLEAFAAPPSQAEGLRGRGWCLLDLKRYGEAAEAFEAAWERQSDPTLRRECLLKAADARFLQGRYEAALVHYRRFEEMLADAPERPRAAYQAAECLRRLRQFDAARAGFRRVLATWPDSEEAPAAAYALGLVEEDVGDWSAAEAAYEAMRRQFPPHPLAVSALLGQGRARYRQGRFALALEDFDQLLERHPDRSEAEIAGVLRVWCLYLLGREEAAVEAARAFVEQQPKSEWRPEVLFWLGEQRFNRRQWNEAEQVFARLAAEHPASPLADRAFYWAGRAAAAAKEYRRALEYYGKLAAQYPASPLLAEARFAQGDALSELGEFALAILAFESLIRSHPSSYLVGAAWGRIGDCHFTLAASDSARYPEAIESYRQARETPGVTEELRMQATFKIGRCYERMGRAEDALAHYMEVVYAFWQLREEGRGAPAVWFTRAAFAAGALLEQRNAWREALAVYRRVADLDGPAAEDARDRIARIRREYWRLF